MTVVNEGREDSVERTVAVGLTCPLPGYGSQGDLVVVEQPETNHWAADFIRVRAPAVC
jgi:hypothetical protein